MFHPEEGERQGNTFGETPCFNYILGSYSSYLCIYKDLQLTWTAKTQSPPIFVETEEFQNQKGLIVTLSDKGWLQVSYLGTEAPKSTANVLVPN